MDNIARSLQEDLLQDVINKPMNLLIEGVDSAVDVDAYNSRFQALDKKIQALIALLYLKESTLLTVKKDDAVAGSFCFNKEKNTFEYFDGNAWQSNIFSPNTVMDYKTFSTDELNPIIVDGMKMATLSSLPVNMGIADDQVVLVSVDGDMLSPKMFYVDKNDTMHIQFVSPVTVYDNISYYVVGVDGAYSGSIPRDECVEYTGTGSRNTFPISYNPNFIVSYKSSVKVIVDGLIIRNTQFDLNSLKNQVVLKEAPRAGAKIEIRTTYGVVTDFRSSLTYVEQIAEATIANQKTFKYNGVSDAVKVYLNGRRLISGIDFDFNYVQKLVILNDELTATVKVGDKVIIEKEMAPLSKEPMAGKMITETYTLSNGSAKLAFTCNGVSSLFKVEGSTLSPIKAANYFIDDKNQIVISDPTYASSQVQVSYLTNATIQKDNIPTISDQDTTASDKTWSSLKIYSALSLKAHAAGQQSQDFSTRDLHVYNNCQVDGTLNVNSNSTINGLITAQNIDIKVGDKQALKTNEDSNTLDVSYKAVFQDEVTFNKPVTFTQQVTNVQMEHLQVTKNSIELNSNLTSTKNPVEESMLIVNRGKNGKASLVFNEASAAWFSKVGTESKALSLDGHTHTLEQITGTDFASGHFITSSATNKANIYTKTEMNTILNDGLSETTKKKVISKLEVEKSKVVAGESDGTIQSSTLVAIKDYEKLHGSEDSSIKTRFASLEDGSVFINSEGALVLPQGPTAKRWEADNNFCGISGSTFKTSVEELSTGNKWQQLNGLIRYNTDSKAVEMKIDGSWVQFTKPDVATAKLSGNLSYQRGRFITSFDKTDFVELGASDVNANLGFQQGEKVLKIKHDLNSLYVSVNIFDDKRASLPLLYKCIDENNVYISFPSNMQELAGNNDIASWFTAMDRALHKNTVEGPGHENKVDTSKSLDTQKKFVVIINAL